MTTQELIDNQAICIAEQDIQIAAMRQAIMVMRQAMLDARGKIPIHNQSDPIFHADQILKNGLDYCASVVSL